MHNISIIRKKKLDNVLIIGGGDFEIAHHLFENKIIKKLSIVEIDYDVVKSCKKYFPLNHNLKKNEKNKYLDDVLSGGLYSNECAKNPLYT